MAKYYVSYIMDYYQEYPSRNVGKSELKIGEYYITSDRKLDSNFIEYLIERISEENQGYFINNITIAGIIKLEE